MPFLPVTGTEGWRPVDGRPGVRFRATQSRNGVTSQTTMILTFKGTTQYLFTCTHQERAEIERGCAEIVRTFKVLSGR
jgi:hypothetical protein